MSSVLTAPASPYKGLAPYGDSDLDALFFFGRERDRDVIVANLIAARLTVLYGPSGVGKSSVLRAGVAYRLRELARRGNGRPEHAVAVVDTWAGDPVDAILGAAGADRDETLARSLEAWTQQHDATLYLILDQFEEYFLYHGDEAGGPLGEELADVLTQRPLRVNVLFSLREDALAQLDAFKGRIPNLFANSLRLGRLDRRAGRSAIVGPVERYDDLVPKDARVEIEPELVEAVLDEVTLGKVELGTAGRGEVPAQEAETGIEAPYLQLVMERLWEAEQAEGSRVLELATLRRLGGAVSIVRSHLERALGALTEEQREVAANVFNHLVTPSGTKIAHRAGDLAEYAAIREMDLVPVLTTLGRERIVRAVDGAASGAARYEIFHDVLADAVLEWRARQQLERERRAADERHRRLLIVTAISLAAFALMAVLAVYALSERASSRSLARRAHANELAARSLVQLDVDPQRSLDDAVDAADLERTTSFEDVLRKALLAERLRQIWRIGGTVEQVAYSPDGRTVATGSTDGSAQVWDAKSGRRLRTLKQEPRVAALAYDPRGRLLVAGGDSAKLWPAARGAHPVVFRHSTIDSATISRDGKLVVTAGDRTARIWRARNGRLLRTIHEAGRVQLAALSPNATRMVTVAADRNGVVQPRLYDVGSGRRLRTLAQLGATDAEFSPNGSLLATASADGTTTLWRARDGAPLRTLNDLGKSIVDLTFSPDGSLLATASSDSAIRVWRVETGDRFFFFVGHGAPATSVVFDPTGQFVVSTSEDRTARIWEIAGVEAGKLVGLLAGHRDTVLRAAFSPDARSIVTGSADGTARVWDARIERHLAVVGTEPGEVTRASFVADGRRVADLVGARVNVRESRGGPVLGSFPASTRVSTFSADGRVFAFATPGGGLVVDSASDGRSLATFHQDSPITAVSLRADGAQVAAAGADGVVRIWGVGTRHLLHEVKSKGAVDVVGLSPRGDVVVTAGDGDTAQLWSTDGTRLRVLSGHLQPITDARFDPAGERVITASEGSQRNVIVWDVRTGKQLHVLVGHYGTVSAASFSADGRWILTAGPIAAAIWPADTGKLLFYLRGPTALLTDAEWAPSGYRVVVASRDRTVRTFSCDLCLPLDELVALARTRLAAAR